MAKRLAGERGGLKATLYRRAELVDSFHSSAAKDVEPSFVRLQQECWTTLTVAMLRKNTPSKSYSLKIFNEHNDANLLGDNFSKKMPSCTRVLANFFKW